MCKPIIFFLLVFLSISCGKNKGERNKTSINYFQSKTNRLAAEWEPVKGVFFVWPPVIPKELIIELANDTQIYPIVDGEEGKRNAKHWFEKWGIDLKHVNFIQQKTDFETTVRDWGPNAVFTSNGEFKILDGQFRYSCPASDLICNDSLVFHINDNGDRYLSTHVDTAIVSMGRQLGMNVMELPFTNTGGNVLTDGVGTAFSTCVLLTENRFNGIPDEAFFQLNDSLLGISEYHVISNFDNMGIQHIDCLLKLIDEETLLVAEPPEHHELYPIYENIVRHELSNLKTVYNRPYTIKRIKLGVYFEDEKTAYLSAYTNSIILNGTVYVPLFGIEEDSLALKTWASVMPGYTIKGFNYVLKEQPITSKFDFEGFDEIGVATGWAYENAIHCRTKPLWQEDMLFITLKKVESEISVMKDAILYATVIDYSNERAAPKNVSLMWRKNGDEKWNTVPMESDGNLNHWKKQIPFEEKETEIEYYVEATSVTGKLQRRPITAPKGFYSFKYTIE